VTLSGDPAQADDPVDPTAPTGRDEAGAAAGGTPRASVGWLAGHWEGAGVGGYPGMESFQFGQELEVAALPSGWAWRSRTWQVHPDGTLGRALAAESGFLRTPQDGSVELVLAHGSGVAEVYVGEATGQRLELRTDVVVRTASASPYAAGVRLYGLVDDELLWAFDMAAGDQEMASHVSARLRRVAVGAPLGAGPGDRAPTG